MKKHLAALLAVAALTAPLAATAGAVSPGQAKTYMHDMGQRALDALRAADDPMARFGRVMIEGVDFVTISRGALGRQARRLGAAELRQVGELLAALVINLTSERLRGTEIADFRIGEARTMPNGDVIVKARIDFAGGEPLATGWRIRERDSRLRIVDIEVEGYSIRIHYQNQFERLLRYDGVAGLLKSLRQKLRGTPGLAWVQAAAAQQSALN
jgi:phospholipid transport system substrate-binding protein